MHLKSRIYANRTVKQHNMDPNGQTRARAREYMNSLQRFIRRSETMNFAMCTCIHIHVAGCVFGIANALVKSTFQVVSLIRSGEGMCH